MTKSPSELSHFYLNSSKFRDDYIHIEGKKVHKYPYLKYILNMFYKKNTINQKT